MKLSMKRIFNINRNKAFVLFLAVLLSVILILPAGIATAQTTVEGWKTPFNLSKSGQASFPVMVIDSAGVIHASWYDKFAGNIYSRFENGSWSKPVSAPMPFVELPGSLINDDTGIIHAFWTGGSKNRLFYNRTVVADMGKPRAWRATVPIVDNVGEFSVLLDGAGQMHIAFIRVQETPELPAGLYIIHSKDHGLNWTPPQLLYASQYYRGLGRELINLQIVSNGNKDGANLQIVWDNRPRKQVWYTASSDGGKTWTQPDVIQQPEADTLSESPMNIRIGVKGTQALIVWQSNSAGGNCSTLYRWSADGGKTWTRTSEVKKDVSVCTIKPQIFNLDGQFLLISETQGQASFLAWNGSQWSLAQLQPLLVGFNDPESFSQVTLSCKQYELKDGNSLFVIGCDVGPGKDVWASNRTITGLEKWYPQPLVWSNPVVVKLDRVPSAVPNVLSGSGERLNAFWVGDDTASPGLSQIYQAFWDGNRWNKAIPVLKSPQGAARQPSVVRDNQDRFLAVWSGGPASQLYFSWAAVGAASTPGDWSEPIQIPTPPLLTASPHVAVGPDETIYVVYATPINEKRGIYLVKSSDGGKTWGNAVQIFDAEAVGWEMIDYPQAAVAADGTLHVGWIRLTVPGGDGPLGFFYSNSTDGGKTWSSAAPVMEGRVLWSAVESSSDGRVHRLWVEDVNSRRTLKHQFSIDSGKNWSRPSGINTTVDTGISVVVTHDDSGKLHLLQIASDVDQKIKLTHREWDQDNWVQDDAFELDRRAYEQVNGIGASIAKSGRLGVLFGARVVGNPGEAATDQILFTGRTVGSSGTALTTPAPASTPDRPATPISPGQITATSVASSKPSASDRVPTPTPNLAAIRNVPNGEQTSVLTSWIGLIIGAGLAVLIALIAVVVRLNVQRARY
jgi:hypothetical protein